MANRRSILPSHDRSANETVRVLLVGGSPTDDKLITNAISELGRRISTSKVHDAVEFERVLTNGIWDLIVADTSSSIRVAVEALEVVNRSARNVPFIALSDQPDDDELALSVIRAGAQDYIPKSDASRIRQALARGLQVAAQDKHNLESMLRLQAAALNSAANAIVITDPRGTIEWANTAFTALTGYTVAEVIGKNLRVLKSGKHDDQLYRDMWATILSGKVWRGELVNRRRDGTLYFEEMTITAVLSDAGEIAHFVAVKEDITKRKNAEEAQARLAAIVEFSEDAIISKSLDGVVLSWNESAERLFKFSAEEAIGQQITKLIIPPELVSEEMDFLERLRRGEHLVHHDTVRIDKSGNRLDVAVTISPVRDESSSVIAISTIVRDITERKRDREAMRESEQRWRMLADNISQLAWIADESGSIVWYNQRWFDFTGTTLDEVKGWRWKEVHHPEHVDRVVKKISHCFATGQPWEDVFPLRGRNGDYRWFLSRATPIRDESGTIQRWFGTNTDITEQRNVQLALRESESRSREQAERMAQLAALYQEREQQLHAILDLLPVGIFIADANGTIVRSNPAAQAVWGAAPLLEVGDYGQYRGRHPGSDHYFSSEEWALSRAVLRGEVTITEEVEILTFDDKRKTILNSALPIRDSSGRIVGGVAMDLDITDRKKTERALIMTEKLASVGRMAATIAHEINNPLAAAVNALFLIATDPSLPESVKSNVALAEQELARVSHITKQTLGFYREVGTITSVSLPDVLNQMLELFGPRLKNKNVSIQRDFRSTAKVSANDGEIRQIVSNLISNSLDALPQGGTLVVRVLGPQHLIIQRRMMRMTIADNGEGISKEHLKHVFEPFFTTKNSIGTGLGLWVTHELVKKHEGRIRIKSRRDKGTVVSVWLPLERRSASRSTP